LTLAGPTEVMATSGDIKVAIDTSFDDLRFDDAIVGGTDLAPSSRTTYSRAPIASLDNDLQATYNVIRWVTSTGCKYQ